MAEVRLEVDLAHPPERVWRALTDAALLSEWFMVTDFTPRQGSAFTLVPVHLTGLLGPLAGELLELREPERMVMRWQGDSLHTTVVWELIETGDGCRIKVVQSGFVGAPANLRRRALSATYSQLFAERLPRLLDRLAPSPARIAASAGANAWAGAEVPRQRRPEAETLDGVTVGAAQAAAPGLSLGVGDRSRVAGGGDAGASGPGGAGGTGVVGSGRARPGSAGAARMVQRRSGLGGSGDGAPSAPAAGSVRSLAAGWRQAAGRWWESGRWRAAGWSRWLAVVPAWGRALLIATVAAIVAVVVLAGITQTWLPGFDDNHQTDDRDGPGLAAQPGQEGAEPSPPPGQPAPDTTGGPDRGPEPRPVDARASDGPDVAGQAEAGTEPLSGGSDSGREDGGGRSTGPGNDSTAAAAPLTAVMTTSNRLLGLSGITVSVTISNPGSGKVSEWEVSMDVGDQSVSDVTGAEFERSGSRAYFTPGEAISAGGSVQFSFDIPGPLLGLGSASEPVDCTIDDRPCG